MDTSQCEKLGYPKVLESIEISGKTSYNIKQLCTSIYDIAEKLLSSSTKDQSLFQQRIPAKYIYLEEALEEYRLNKKIPILNDKEYQYVEIEGSFLLYFMNLFLFGIEN